ncbi:MAG: acylneuraminate cytidylyltransferase family protein [Bacteroidia bacterium]|nr:acylneuraminate cytidylyltransferase family protein [Bacteroidia bacterium]
MKILGIIPARGGSKGVKGKNIKSLSGEPLIYYTIKEALKSDLTSLIVSTDDEEISKVAKSYGVEVPFKRPTDLSNDTAKSIDVAVHALNEMERIHGFNYDAIMLLQPTTPFRTYEDINDCLNLMINHPEADSVISVVDVKGHHPARMKYLQDGWLIDPPFCEEIENQNRQELRPMFIRNGAIYLTRKITLLKKSYKGEKCLAYEMPGERSVNIDNMQDFEYAEWLHSKFLK